MVGYNPQLLRQPGTGDDPLSTIRLHLALKQLFENPPTQGGGPPPGYWYGPAMRQFLGNAPRAFLQYGTRTPVANATEGPPSMLEALLKYLTNQSDWRSVLSPQQRNDILQRGANRPPISPELGTLIRSLQRSQ